MPRTTTRQNQNNFSAGKISDSNAINPVEGGLRFAHNVDISLNGRIGRRLGLELEDDFNFPYNSGTSSWEDGYAIPDLVGLSVSDHFWEEVNDEPGFNFRVFRIGNDLYIYEEGLVPYSSGYIDKVTITSTYIPSGVSAVQSADGAFDAVSGRGVLFCTGTYYEPFYITYDADTTSFTLTAITVKVRDIEGVDDGLETDEHPLTLTNSHLYNLYNQGWPDFAVRDTNGVMKLPHLHYFDQQGEYPSNSDIWFFAQTQDGTLIKFNSAEMADDYFGNTPAPKGKIIYDFLSPAGRKVAANVAISNDTITTTRSNAVAFYAGRLWMNFRNRIVYSKIIENLLDVDIYHTNNDPTAEDINQVLDTDGGTLSAIDIGTVYRFVTLGRYLVAFSNRGVFSISGVDGSFTANDQSIRDVTDVAAVSPDSIVKSQGEIYFWADEGIFKILQDPATGLLVSQDISKGRISVDYNAIPGFSKSKAIGVYDKPNQTIYWFFNYNTLSATDVYSRYTDCLVYNIILNSFWDYRFSNEDYTGSAISYPFVGDVFKSSSFKFDEENITVVQNISRVNLVVAVGPKGDNTSIAVSDEGDVDVSWTEVNSSPVTDMDWDFVGNNNNGSWIVLAHTSHALARATDPASDWTLISSDIATAFTNDIGDAAYSSALSRWVIVAKDGIITSVDDGVTWTANTWASTTFAQDWHTVKYLNSRFVAVAENAGTTQVMYSDTGVVTGWTLATTPADQYYNDIDYSSAQSRWIAGGFNTSKTGPAVIYSDDNAVNWLNVDYSGTAYSPSSAETVQCVLWDPSSTVAGGTGAWLFSIDVFSGVNGAYHSTGTDIWTLFADGRGNTFWKDVILLGSQFPSTQTYVQDNFDFAQVWTGPWDTGVVSPAGLGVEHMAVGGPSNIETIITNTGDTVVVSVDRRSYSSSGIRFLVFLPDATASSSYRGTFAELTSRTFYDWGGINSLTTNTNYTSAFPAIAFSGRDYTSYVETLPQTLGEPSLNKQAYYLHTYYDYIRGGYSFVEIPTEFDS